MDLKFPGRASGRVRWLLAFGLLAACSVGWFIIRYKHDADRSTDWVNHTYEVIHALDRIAFELADGGVKRDRLLDFQRLTQDNPLQVKHYNALLLQLSSKEHPAARQLIDQMMQEEKNLLLQRQSDLRTARDQFTLALSGALATTLLAIIFILLKIKSDDDRRKAMEVELKKSEAKYRNLIDNVSGVIYSANADGMIEYASSGVSALTGYEPEDVQGRSFSFLVDPRWLQKVYEHYSHQLKTGGRETTLEFCIVTKSGEIKWVEQAALLLMQDGRPAGFQCFVKDISEKKQMQQELEAFEFKLKENQLLLQSILDNTTSIIYVKSLTGKYVIANRRFMQLFGFTESQVINHTDYDLCPVEAADRYKAIDEEVLRSGQSVEVEERIPGPDGHIHLLLTKFPLRDSENNILGISGIATDITERVHHQQELEAAKTEADDARKMQEQFLANMSHEIRTPMNGIHGMTNLLLETPLNTQQKEFADIIERSVESLLVIINDILDLSKIKAGKLAIEKIDFRLQDVIENIQSLFAHRTKKKGLLFDIELDPAVPEWMQGDPHRLNQVLINLVGNAIKFTDAGSIRMVIRQEEGSTGIVNLVFSVTDSGIGIPESGLRDIFESFTQGAMDVSRKYGGTGLGLAICHQLLALQGGSISVSSKEGEGSCFSFRIAYGYKESGHAGRPTAHAISDFSALLTGRHFLVVEDNPVNQKLMDFVIRKAGGQVTLAENGKEAIQYLESETYDLIIMDLQMPVMDGYETTKFLRGQLQLRTPVLAMSANAISGEQIRCLEAGMNDYLSKPFDFREFYLHVVELLNDPGAIQAIGKVRATGSTYNLSLLEEVGDEGYVQDILNTFLSGLPQQLKELQEAGAKEDFERLFFLAHRLKGSTGMMQARVLTDKLSKLEELSKKRTGASEIIAEVMVLFEGLVYDLEKEKRQTA